MIVAGGVYVETCVTPPSRVLMGSGGRAAVAASGSGPVSLHTFQPLDQEENLHANFGPLGIDVTVHPSSGIVAFDYLHPLSSPRISPIPLPHADAAPIRGAHVLRFGCLEGGFVVDAEAAVYDPQNGAAPERFSANGSRAGRLALVLNAGEARALSGHGDLGPAAATLIEREHAAVIIIKDGPVGAHVFEPARPPERVPAYEAIGSHKIGSGDVFSATFARLWFSGAPPAAAADAASRHAAHYVSTRILPCPADLPHMEPRTMRADLRVLVVSTVATTAAAWVCEEAVAALRNLGARAGRFDPGRVRAEPQGRLPLQWSDWDAVLAIVEAPDDPTLGVLGPALAQGKRVVAFAERKGAVRAAAASGCDVVGDLAGSLYRVVKVPA